MGIAICKPRVVSITQGHNALVDLPLRLSGGFQFPCSRATKGPECCVAVLCIAARGQTLPAKRYRCADVERLCLQVPQSIGCKVVIKPRSANSQRWWAKDEGAG